MKLRAPASPLPVHSHSNPKDVSLLRQLPLAECSSRDFKIPKSVRFCLVELPTKRFSPSRLFSTTFSVVLDSQFTRYRCRKLVSFYPLSDLASSPLTETFLIAAPDGRSGPISLLREVILHQYVYVANLPF